MKTNLTPFDKQNNQRGFALISVLLILVVLTVSVTAFLTNMRIERIAARNIVNVTQAQVAADSAFTDFSQKLRHYFHEYPDSATTWQTIQNHEFAAFYYRDKPADADAADFILPLVSGAQVKAYSEKEDTLPTFTDTNSIDLNADNWIGTLPGENQKEFRAPWVEQYDANGKVISRYAFWAEDESFKVNVNVATNVGRGDQSLGRSPSEIPMQGIFAQIGNPDGLASDIVNGRKTIPGLKFFTLAQINHVASIGEEPKLSDSVKFLATAFSSALNMSRHGSKRLNLNEVVKDSSDGGEIRRQLDQIIGAIKYHLPDFGQRFYLGNLNSKNVSSVKQDIYLHKIAANIRDYIDTDSQPTIVGNKDNDGELNSTFSNQDIWIGSAPDTAIGPNIGSGNNLMNQVIAIGQENVPRLQEVIMHVKQNLPEKGNPAPGMPQASYNIDIDYYFEFWNPTTKDININDLGSNPYIGVANQPGWEAGDGDSIEAGKSRDYKISLKNIPNLTKFPAGSVVVITTDPDPDITQITEVPNLYSAQVDEGERHFEGITTYGVGEGGYGGYATLQLSTDRNFGQLVAPAKGYDYETEFFLANSAGYLDSVQGALPIAPSVYVDAFKNKDKRDVKMCHWRGGVLIGNKLSNLQEGDPRTLSEQHIFEPNSQLKTTVPTQTRFKLTNTYKDSAGDQYFPCSAQNGASLGEFNLSQTDILKWKDPLKAESGMYLAGTVANEPLYSIGQLGDIFDPTRQNSDFARGGGITLKIGQSDQFKSGENEGGHWDGNQDSLSRNWAAWRLTDIFTTTNALEIEGLVNINGIMRDNGVSLKSLLNNYSFRPFPEGEQTLASKDLQDAFFDNFINWIKQTFSQNSPFLERGEISEYEGFSNGSEIAGVNMKNVNDRGREELFKRLIELISTKGNTYSIYIVGQSIRETSAGNKQVLGSVKRKITFKVEPIFNTPLSDNESSNTRYRKPDNYAIKVINISSI
jgi:Tfp pilus assembly protein PilX